MNSQIFPLPARDLDIASPTREPCVIHLRTAAEKTVACGIIGDSLATRSEQTV